MVQYVCLDYSLGFFPQLYKAVDTDGVVEQGEAGHGGVSLTVFAPVAVELRHWGDLL